MKNYLLCIFLAVLTISIYGQNHKNAADYRTDAINGNAIAQFYLGQSYFRGWGIKPDTIQAVYWWRKSAEQGNPAAQNNMGAAYSNGWWNWERSMKIWWSWTPIWQRRQKRQYLRRNFLNAISTAELQSAI